MAQGNIVPGGLYIRTSDHVLIVPETFNERWDRKKKKHVRSGPRYVSLQAADVDRAATWSAKLGPGPVVCIGAYHIDRGSRRSMCYDIRLPSGRRLLVVPAGTDGQVAIVPALPRRFPK